MKNALRERLATGRVLLCDGAMGTMLQATAREVGEVPELLNVQHPERVLAVHLAYVAAGADLITTNTFGGNRITLARAGMANTVHELNQAGVEIARGAAGSCVFVAASVGPTGDLLEPFGNLSEEEAMAAYAEQAQILAAAGADLFLVETMSDLTEAKAAVAGIKRVSDLPVFCTMTFDTGGRTMMGVAPAQAAVALAAAGADGCGANCGQGPEEMEPVVRVMVEAWPGGVVVAQPNAGLPSLQEGSAVYDYAPEAMAEHARRFAALGVRVIGSCCGSTPAHTKAIAQALEDYR